MGNKPRAVSPYTLSDEYVAGYGVLYCMVVSVSFSDAAWIEAIGGLCQDVLMFLFSSRCVCPKPL